MNLPGDTEHMETSPVESSRRPVNQMRWIGVVMFMAGCVLTYLCIILPLKEASHHEEDVSISAKGVMLAPALIVIGLFLFFKGNERAGQLFGTKAKPKAAGLLICFVTGLIGILLYEWLRSRLRAYGYH